MATAGKTGGKTAKPGAFKKGADPRRGGGKKGRSGRKPVSFYIGCEDATENSVLPKVLDYLARADRDPSDPAWQWCAAYVSRFSRSEAPKRTEVTGKDGNAVDVKVTVTRRVIAVDADDRA